MVEKAFIRLLDDTGTWAEFQQDWRAQCERNNEDFDGYAEATVSAVREIILEQKRSAGVFGLKRNNKFMALCQINRAPLPGYDGPVLRTRFITVCPDLDLGEFQPNLYGQTLVDLFEEVLIMAMNDPEMKARHIKFHLRSPAETQFFSAIGRGLGEAEIFESVATRGAWLYISLK